MELIKFRVSMYKGIIDSGWVDVNNLTVLVGKNESGKTSLLKALHKLNPDTSEAYDIEKEWPRGHPSKPNEGQVICQAKFRLSDREKSHLSKITAIREFADTIEVSRNYAGELEIKFEEEPFSGKLRSGDVSKFIDSLPKIPDGVSPHFRHRAVRCLRDTINAVDKEDHNKLKEIADAREEYLRRAVSPLEPTQEIESGFINQYRISFQNAILELERLSAVQVKANRYVTGRLPKFIYMDDYRIFSGTARLDEVQNRRDEDKLTEADQTFLTILELSELDLDKLVQLGEGDGEKATQRYYERTNGGATLTKKFSEHLRQRKYEVKYQADGHHFLTFVRDDIDPTAIELTERSKGFQWFFSFDLMLMHGSKGTFKGSVILLDEPGLHLHPNAQKDLLRRFEEYAEENTLLYTTHLPFMIDPHHPERIRILKESKEGINVTTNLVEPSPEARFVLQAALGMDASHSLLIADRNLVVEGVHDYYILTGLSNLLKRSGRDGLLEDVRITPGPNASEAVRIAALMVGQNLNVVVLFDSDEAGRESHEKLLKTWLLSYTEKHTKVILLGDAVGVDCDFELEDFFTEDFMKEIVKETYSKELANAGIDEIVLEGDGMIWDRIEEFQKKHKIDKIKKGSIAKRLRNRLNKMEDISELPPETKEKAIKLFQSIRNAFGEEETESS